MLRASELVAFLAPFIAYLVWRRVAAGAGPSATTLAMTLVGLALFGGALAWFGVHQALVANETYVPARVVDGQIVPGHSARP